MIAPPSILVVEDEDDLRDEVMAVFQAAGCAARTASNGEVALARLRDGSPLPALILLDMGMPVLDGPGFRAAQLADPTLASVPVVVMSASIWSLALAERLGAAGWLRKPVGVSDLLAVARQFLGPAVQRYPLADPRRWRVSTLIRSYLTADVTEDESVELARDAALRMLLEALLVERQHSDPDLRGLLMCVDHTSGCLELRSDGVRLVWHIPEALARPHSRA